MVNPSADFNASLGLLIIIFFKNSLNGNLLLNILPSKKLFPADLSLRYMDYMLF
jgi:hypothetical protein